MHVPPESSSETACDPPPSDWSCSLLVLIPLRLGISNVNAEYIEVIRCMWYILSHPDSEDGHPLYRTWQLCCGIPIVWASSEAVPTTPSTLWATVAAETRIALEVECNQSYLVAVDMTLLPRYSTTTWTTTRWTNAISCPGWPLHPTASHVCWCWDWTHTASSIILRDHTTTTISSRPLLARLHRKTTKYLMSLFRRKKPEDFSTIYIESEGS